MSDVLYHAKRDPLICTHPDGHAFQGWREFPDGLGGEAVCAHCGVGAMEHTIALDAEHDVFGKIARGEDGRC